MKFKIGDDVRSLTTGQVGEVVNSEYIFRIKNGDVQESKRYFIKWRDRQSNMIWTYEYNLTHVDENLKTENEYIAEMSLLELQIDQALANGDKETFRECAAYRNELLDEMEIRGFVKQRKNKHTFHQT